MFSTPGDMARYYDALAGGRLGEGRSPQARAMTRAVVRMVEGR